MFLFLSGFASMERGIWAWAATLMRAFDDDFSTSSARLEAATREACALHDEWPAKLAAAIYSALDFVVENPAAGRALTIDACPCESSDNVSRRRTKERFSRLLGELTPNHRHIHGSAHEGLIGIILTMVADYLRTERAERLRHMASDLAYVILVPYCGFQEANRWVDGVCS